MLFNSVEFLFFFLPISLLGYISLRSLRLPVVGLTFIILASIFFYAWWDWTYLPVLIGSITFNYLAGRIIKTAETNRKLLTGICISANLIALAYFKYAHFLIQNFNQMTGTTYVIKTIGLPLAISFFTFQQIAYLVDACRGEVKDYDFTDYLFFTTFYPHLIAGPILHHREIIPQIDRKQSFQVNWEHLGVGFSLFFLGLFKKTVLADSLSPFADEAFNQAANGVKLTFFNSWVGTLAFTFQIYFDFSGYSDMAIGLGWLFGIRLPINFLSPYKARSIIEFWRRWHITLSHFLRDYLYISLGGNRHGLFRQRLNLLATMLLGGLWHGASWTFVMWGGLHGAYLVVNHEWRKRRASTESSESPLTNLMAQVVTFLSVMLAWVFFRATSLGAALGMLKSMFGFDGVAVHPRLAMIAQIFPKVFRVAANGENWFTTQSPYKFIGMALFSALILWRLPNSYEFLQLKERHEGISHLKFRPSTWQAVLLGIIAAWSVTSLRSKSEFIYFQF